MTIKTRLTKNELYFIAELLNGLHWGPGNLSPTDLMGSEESNIKASPLAKDADGKPIIQGPHCAQI